VYLVSITKYQDPRDKKLEPRTKSQELKNQVTCQSHLPTEGRVSSADPQCASAN